VRVVFVSTPDGEVGWPLIDAPLRRICALPHYAPPDDRSRYGYWAGRPIIGRDSPVNGGVYLGLGHVGEGRREALLVDDSAPEALLHDLYDRLLAEIAYLRDSEAATLPLGGHAMAFLRAVMTTTQECMNRDDEKAGELGRLLLQVQEERRDETGVVPLDYFIQLKVGTCRHYALLACYLIERLLQAGVVEGTVSLDRCAVVGGGRHAWTRVECGDRVFVVDIAHGYLGSIDGPQAFAWYRRPPESVPKPTADTLDLWDRVQRPEAIAALVSGWMRTDAASSLS
jgi:hypothetical protein